jgi:probable HAF family extracellular repeat protein
VGLGTFSGATSSYASGVSGDGSVVVGFASFETHYEPFRWRQETGMVSLGKPDGAEWSQVGGVSGDGTTVVGGSWFPETMLHKATIWNGAGGPQLLAALPGSDHSGANNISADGTTIVGFNRTSVGIDRAVRWTDEGIDEIDSRNGGSSHAVGVSQDGTYIVGAFTPTNSDNQEAFLWSESTGMMGLGLLDGPSPAIARGVSSDGSGRGKRRLPLDARVGFEGASSGTEE